MYAVLFVLDYRSAQSPGRECWTVEAAPGRGVPPANYELCRDSGTDRWTLSRA
jgi:hypothetical protein